MKALKIWGWFMLASSVILCLYGWISGLYNGHGIVKMDNVALLITIISLVCLLIAITVFVVSGAIKHIQSDK